MSGLSDITILITAFLRPGLLADCLVGIEKNLPECRVLVVDDSEQQPEHMTYDDYLNGRGLTTIHLPFDSGLSAKRNAGVKACKTKFLLMGSDDFDFSTKEARKGIIKLYEVMRTVKEIDVAGGRHGNNPYEGFLEYVPGEYIREHRLEMEEEEHLFYNVDLTVNYFLGRTKRLLPWDERMKIGGEHGDWFLSMKEAGRRTVWVPGVNIEALPYDAAKQDPRYPSFRARARDLGHRIFKEKRNIKEYRDWDGNAS